jgi:hypothetical protein
MCYTFLINSAQYNLPNSTSFGTFELIFEFVWNLEDPCSLDLFKI